MVVEDVDVRDLIKSLIKTHVHLYTGEELLS